MYQRRWNVELDLRWIKTTLGMEVLRCRTPAMVEKELWVQLWNAFCARSLCHAPADHLALPAGARAAAGFAHVRAVAEIG